MVLAHRSRAFGFARFAAFARLVSLASLALTVSSCFAVTDLDRFESAAVSSGNFTDLKFTIRGMTSHVAERFEYRVVDGSNVIQSRGLVVPLGGVAATIFVRGAVPKQNGPFRLDFYAEHDGVPGYATGRDPLGDHAWRLPLDESRLDEATGTYVVAFDHNTSFTFLNEPAVPREIGQKATARLRNMTAFVGKRVEVRVFDASSGRVVALYRVPVLPAAAGGTADTDLSVDGMIENGVTYGVELYTDDGNGGAIQAFRSEFVATATGLDVALDPATLTRVTDVVPP